MKISTLTIVCTAIMLLNCGDSDKAMSPEQEAQVANTLTVELQIDTQTLKQSTTENIQEVDSLLQNF